MIQMATMRRQGRLCNPYSRVLSFILQELREEFKDGGSGASTARGGYLVNGTTSDGESFTIRNSEVRNALNLSAWYPSFTTWDPFSGTIPVSTVAPSTKLVGALSTCPTLNLCCCI